MSKIIRSVALGAALAMTGAACSHDAPPPHALTILSIDKVGTPGTSLAFEGWFSLQNNESTSAHIGAVIAAGHCGINLTIRSFEAAALTLRHAPHSQAGGDAYIHDFTDAIDAKVFAAQQAVHACVDTVVTTEPIVVKTPKGSFEGTVVDGFSLSTNLAESDGRINALDEAATEWLAIRTDPAVEPRHDFAAVTELFGDLKLSVSDVRDELLNSDIESLTIDVTGRNVTAQDVGCVLEQFEAVQAGEIFINNALEAIKSC